MGKLVDVNYKTGAYGQIEMDFPAEKRNICWNCEKEFNTTDERNFIPKEKGQKQYLYCNHCGKVNHL